jgi:hypothetical protein
MQIPESVLVYFDLVAARISSLARRKVPRKNGVAKAVASAVGLECRGGYNPFDWSRGWARTQHETMIAISVFWCYCTSLAKQPHGVSRLHDLKTIYKDGAVAHNQACGCGRSISWKTAERYFRKHAKVVIPADLQRDSKSQKISDILR